MNEDNSEIKTLLETAPKAFVVTSGDYSDYRIDAVFTTREKAEAYAKEQNAKRTYQDSRVEQYVMDHGASITERGWKFYHVSIAWQDGTVSATEYQYHGEAQGSIAEGYRGSSWTLIFWLYAKSQYHAVKIAAERRQRAIALYGPELTEANLDTVRQHIISEYSKL